MIEYLPSALASLQSALGLGKAIMDVKDVAESQTKLIEFNGAIIDAQQKIMSAQQEQASLLRQIEDLKEELASQNRFSEDTANYSRTEFAPGIFAVIDSDFDGKLVNAHKYCCSCFEKQCKSTLQQFNISVGRNIGLKCPNGCPDLEFHAYKDMY
jgi:hypothetical protein